MSYEALVGWRYTRAQRRNRFVSIISLISMVGIALGVAALVVVLSIMNGFQRELRARMLGVVAHVQVSGEQGRLTDWVAAAATAASTPGVIATAPYVSTQAMLSVAQSVRGANVRGIDPKQEGAVADLDRHMRAGRLEALLPGEFGIILGADLANFLRVRPGDRVAVIASQGLVTPAGVVPRVKQFRVVGLFEIGMYEYDSGLALVHIEDAQRLFRFGDAVSGVRLKLAELFDAPQIVQTLTARLPGAQVTDWTQTHASFFRAVQVEKNVMFVILMLIVGVAAFNIVSTLIMVVTDKRPDIAILRTLGASPGGIMRIFMVQGSLIGGLGTVFGLVGGIVLATNIDVIVPVLESMLNLRLLDPDVYYISRLPTDLQRRDVVIVGIAALLLSFLATLYPSWRAARMRPAEALRYE